MKKPDNLYDDPGWNGFNKSYRQMEIENMHSVLREADLEKEINKPRLIREIKGIYGQAGFRNRRNRRDSNIESTAYNIRVSSMQG